MNALYLYSNFSGEEIAPFDFPAQHPFPSAVSRQKVGRNVLELQTELTPGDFAACQLIPCFSSVCASPYGYQTRIIAGSLGSEEKFSALSASIGNYHESFEVVQPPSNGVVTSEVDIFTTKDVDTLIIRLTIISQDLDDLMRQPWLFSLCVAPMHEDVRQNTIAYPTDVKCSLNVPQKSQMLEPDDIRNRICSPTSTAMVLDYWGHQSSVQEIARLAYHRPLDLYGVWPSSVWAASRYGLLGYLHKFNDWHEVIWLLRRRIPIITSIAYNAGELRHAAVERTSGHLVVIKGMDTRHVIVNDPAAPSIDTVERRYEIEEFTTHWLRKKAVGYVLFPQRTAFWKEDGRKI